MSVQYLRGSKLMSVDTTEFEVLKRRLTGEELRRASRSGLRRASKILVTETERRYKKLVVKHKGAGKGALGGLEHRGKVLPVATYRLFDSKRNTTPMATVSIRNRRTDFRAQFFELGTAERYTKRPYKAKRGLRNRGRNSRYYPSGMARGRILEGRYFRRAQQASSRRVFAVMTQAINGHIVRVANKR